ncbi:MAG TPA: site-specific integrase [Terriglobales bacterium]|nr:site-specific integrase [Terriglobales bacterium]
MSRRKGQTGHIEKSGKWWVVRWWMDVPGQEERKLKRAKVCPISGPGSLSASERERRGREIIAASGADTVEHFNKVVKQQPATVLTFKEQAQRWIDHRRNRKRKPVSSGTIEDDERTLRNWINPHIGDCPVGDVNNSVLKKLVSIMSKAGLSPKTIENYLDVPKAVVTSVVDNDGNQVYPRKWNNDFIDMPIVDPSRQNRPSFSAEIMTGLANYRHPREQMLFVLAGAAGLRIGEALGIEIDKHLSADCSTISVKQKARRGRVEDRLKTASAYRLVELDPAVANLLKGYIDTRTSGFLFQTRNGTPLSLTNVLRDHLHLALKELGYVNPHTGDHKAGTHAFRRFRNTYLKNETTCPKGLRDYWLGHAGNSMDDLYDMVKDNAAFRKQKAAEYGVGFELPASIVPNVPKNRVKVKRAKAA